MRARRSCASLSLGAEAARRLTQSRAEADHLDQRVRGDLLDEAGDPLHAPHDLAGRVQHAPHPVELHVGTLDRSLHFVKERDGLLADTVDQHLRALEHAICVEQYHEEAHYQQAPEDRHDDQRDVAAGGEDHGALLNRGGPASYPPDGWLVVALLALVGGLIVTLALEPVWAVLLLDLVAREVVRVLVALPMAQLACAGVGGVTEVRWHRISGRGILLSFGQSRVDAVRLRRPGDIQRR